MILISGWGGWPGGWSGGGLPRLPVVGGACLRRIMDGGGILILVLFFACCVCVFCFRVSKQVAEREVRRIGKRAGMGMAGEP